MKFRKKPVVIEAIQWTGSNLKEIEQFINQGKPWGNLNNPENVIIHTLEGDHTASKGDWIIKGVHGEFCPCKPDIFQLTYESAESHPAPTDLLLTEQIQKIKTLVNGCFSFDPQLVNGCFSFDPQLSADSMKLLDDYLDSLQSKLLQARPTEQVREKIAESLWKNNDHYNTPHMNWETYKTQDAKGAKHYYFLADQILSLLPDEQSIEKQFLDKLDEAIVTRQKMVDANGSTSYLAGMVQGLKQFRASLQSGQMPEEK